MAITIAVTNLALRNAYPEGLTVEELAKKTKLPLKTIYAQKAELYREYYINHVEEETAAAEEAHKKRGRPPTHIRDRDESLRKRVRIVIEDASGVHDVYEGKKPVPLPPGNVVYSDGFVDACHKIVGKDEEEELCKILLQFIERIFNRITVSGTQFNQGYGRGRQTGTAAEEEAEEEIKNRWAPEKAIDFCCSQCGLNHEARDFVRAILLHLIDQLEKNSKFIDFLKDNQFLTQQAYEHIKTTNE